MRAVIFDFDGVVYDTFDFHRRKIREFTGVDLSEDDFRSIHNGNFYSSVPDAIKSVNWPDYVLFVYPEQSSFKIKDDVKKTIISLSKDFDLFMVTSGGTKNISDCLRNNNLLSLFKEVLGLESHKSKVDKFRFIFSKYGLSPDDCVFVTDTLGDILEANKVGLRSIAVDFGFHDRKTLTKGDPFTIVSGFEEIEKIIRSL